MPGEQGGLDGFPSWCITTLKALAVTQSRGCLSSDLWTSSRKPTLRAEWAKLLIGPPSTSSYDCSCSLAKGHLQAGLIPGYLWHYMQCIPKRTVAPPLYLFPGKGGGGKGNMKTFLCTPEKIGTRETWKAGSPSPPKENLDLLHAHRCQVYNPPLLEVSITHVCFSFSAQSNASEETWAFINVPARLLVQLDEQWLAGDHLLEHHAFRLRLTRWFLHVKLLFTAGMVGPVQFCLSPVNTSHAG